MKTKCPQCHAAFPINLEQLRSARGIVQCGECLLKFNALSALHEADDIDSPSPNAVLLSSIPVLQQKREEQSAEIKPAQSTVDDADELIAPWETDKPRTSWAAQFFWLLASFAALFLFIGQFYLNEASHNFSNQKARIFFELACEQFQCELPPIKNLSSIDVVDRAIETKPDRLLLKITLANHASHNQPFPNLKLTLSDFKNRPIAQRVFTPTEYLSKDFTNTVMPIDKPIALQLAITPPKENISTFSFEFL